MGSILGESEIKQLVEQHLDKAVDAAFIGEMVAARVVSRGSRSSAKW